MIYRSFIKINKIELFYRDTRRGDTVILCLHGRWGRGETWSDLIRRYEQTYRVIAPDQRGHGLSAKPKNAYNAEDLANDAYSLLQYLKCPPAIVIGHSMGGRIAGYLAALHPDIVKALVIIDESAESIGSSINIQSDDPLDDGLTHTWPTPYKTYDDAEKDLTTRFKRDSNVRYFMDSLIETIDGYDFMFSRSAMAALGRSYRPWYDVLSQITCPVLLVRASESWCLSEDVAEKMLASLTYGSYKEISGSDHMIYADNPNDFYETLEQFLKTL